MCVCRAQPFTGNWTFELFPNNMDWRSISTVVDGMKAPVLYPTAGWLTHWTRPTREDLFQRMNPNLPSNPFVTEAESITQCMPKSWNDFFWPDRQKFHATKGALCCHEACTFK